METHSTAWSGSLEFTYFFYQEQILIYNRQSELLRPNSHLNYDDVKQVSPAGPDHEGHSLVDSLEGGVGDHKQLLSGFH